MKTKTVIAAGLVALGIVGQINAQSPSRSHWIESQDFIGITSDRGEQVGIFRVTPDMPTLYNNVLRIEITGYMHGGRAVYACVGGATPPNCQIFQKPANIAWNACFPYWTFQVSGYWTGQCDQLGNPFKYTFWAEGPRGGYTDAVWLGSVTVYPRLTNATDCIYRFSKTIWLYLPRCSETLPP
jgi:hypothetical protein